MKRLLALLLAALTLFMCAACAEDATVYPGIVAPLNEDYLYAPTEPLDGWVLGTEDAVGLYLKMAPDLESDEIVLVPEGAQFKLYALYPNGNIRISVGIGDCYYTGYICTDMSEMGKKWIVSYDPAGIIPSLTSGNDEE